LSLSLPFKEEPLRQVPNRQQHDWHRAAVGILTNPNAHGAAMMVAALEVFDPDELMEFTPQTIRLDLTDHFHLQELPVESFSRLMALRTAIFTDLFYSDLPSFIELCNVLGRNPPLANMFDFAVPNEIAWAVAEIDLMDPRDDDNVFSEEIRAYIGEMLKVEGFFSPPALLNYAIMPQVASPAEITEDAQLLPAIVDMDIQRHHEIHQFVASNLKELIDTITPLTGPIELKSLQS
jgi:hypothetical protein